jgi:O-methyltransferase
MTEVEDNVKGRRRHTPWLVAKELFDWTGQQLKLMDHVGSYNEFRKLSRQLRHIHRSVPSTHNASHILLFINEFMALPKGVEGCVVECGCYLGGSTCKISLAARLAGRSVMVFDSFQGLPENEEEHEESILGYSLKGWFHAGNFKGSYQEVIDNVTKYGDIEVCRFTKGWFEDTLPRFHEKVCAVYLDIDLASSTKTCLKYLYPLLSPGGVLVSQDGDFPLVIDVFDDDLFWEREVGCEKPEVEGLGKAKMLKIRKPA